MKTVRFPMRGAGKNERGFDLRAAAAALMLCGLAFVATPAPAQQEPAESGIKETVAVRLGEIKILVTDKQGNAITDLRKGEVEVREGGRKVKVAVVEPFATADLSAKITSQSTPLYTTADERLNQESEAAGAVWPAPKAVRHIVLLFDAYNSRTPSRKRWIESAHDWVRDEMRPDDRVALAVMERAKVDLVVPFTDDRDTLVGYLTGESLVSGGTYYDYMNEIRGLLDNLKTCVSGYEPDMCAMSAAQSYLFEWRTRTNQTVGALRRFASSLGAIPGRKAIFYMSDGLVVSPGEVATHAILATLGSDTVSYNRTSSILAQDSHFLLQEAMQVASVSDVTFFTFDTRHSSMRDVSWMAEEANPVHERTVSDPFAVMFDATRSSLDTMSIETGGRSYHGPSIEANLPRAINAIEGQYTVAYYREAAPGKTPRVKVSVARKGIQVTHLRDPEGRIRSPSAARLEIGVMAPQNLADGTVLPVVVQLPAKQLNFFLEEGAMVAEVALYGEAIDATGQRVADVYEMVQVTMSEREYRALEPAARFAHTLHLAVPPGSFRLRVRFSDPEFRFGAERAVDVTVAADGTLAGADP